MNEIQEKLLSMTDEANADFQSKLTPGVPRELFLGIKIPELRKVEKKYRNTEVAKEFLKDLPHKYYDENVLHSVFISNIKNKDEVFTELDRFVSYIDNWAVCDTIKPAVLRKSKDGLLDKIREYTSSDETYTIRIGIGLLMTYYLEEDFEDWQLEIPASIHSEEYYVNMMLAWYFATALAKQWDCAIKYIEDRRLDIWVHNKTIQKARESYRISDEQKKYLHELKIKN